VCFERTVVTVEAVFFIPNRINKFMELGTFPSACWFNQFCLLLLKDENLLELHSKGPFFRAVNTLITIYKWKPYATRPKGRPRVRWEDDVRNEEDGSEQLETKDAGEEAMERNN
jgi:hypothetical protein